MTSKQPFDARLGKPVHVEQLLTLISQRTLERESLTSDSNATVNFLNATVVLVPIGCLPSRRRFCCSDSGFFNQEFAAVPRRC